ncbi:hypothetical protein V1505DRAFT_396112 [Lipomyces doorenjongii]
MPPTHMAKYSRPRDRLGPTYSRKRAITACQVCRFRKTKCDNARPTCGFCRKTGVQCIFEAPETDHSTFDSASLAILDRLSELSSQITQVGRLVTNPSSPRSQKSYSPEASDIIGFVADELSGEKILDWPIFGRSHSITPVIDSLLVTDNCSSVNDQYTGDIPTTELWSLVDQFLLNVHIKNPILDIQSLHGAAATVIRDGFGFDPDSCLLLYVCALGAVSTAYVYPHVNLGRNSLEAGYNNIKNSMRYFSAASNRLSIVPKFSLLEIQCYVLSGIYHMFTMHPLLAWRQFNIASVSCQIYFKSESRETLADEVSRGLEQRLFWTVLKSECEIRTYIPAPSSGIVGFEYPSMFPCPPSVHDTESTQNSTDAYVPLRSSVEAAVERKSWYYYLTEIALRKIENSVINVLYRDANESWATMPFPVLVEIITEFETQLGMCHRGLVDEISFDLDTLHKHDELIFHLQERFWEIYKLLYRPVLYCAIRSAVEVNYPEHVSFIGTALTKLFHYSSQTCGPPYYRHHGTWFVLRSIFSNSLIVLAGLKVGKLAYDNAVRENFMNALRELRYWQDEVPDLKEIVSLLEGLWTEVRMGLGAGGLLL